MPNPARNLPGTAGLDRNSKNGRITDLPEPEPKSGTTLHLTLCLKESRDGNRTELGPN